MRVILCDKCKTVLQEDDKIIVVSAVSYKLDANNDIKWEGVNISVLNGEHFCSIKCVKESLA